MLERRRVARTSGPHTHTHMDRTGSEGTLSSIVLGGRVVETKTERFKGCSYGGGSALSWLQTCARAKMNDHLRTEVSANLHRVDDETFPLQQLCDKYHSICYECVFKPSVMAWRGILYNITKLLYMEGYVFNFIHH
jgi:hypothetical protein